MGLVNHDVLEGVPLQEFEVFQEAFVVCQKDVELRDPGLNELSVPLGMQEVALIGETGAPSLGLALIVVEQTVKVGPRLDFSAPLEERREWGQHQERSHDFLVCVQVVQKGNDLDRLSQSHLVRKYRVPVFVPVLDEPVQ